MRQLLVLVCALVCALPALAHEYLVGDLAIIHPHTPPTGPAGDVAHGYMELFNGGSELERLLAVRSGIADVSFFDPNADGGHGARFADAIKIAPGQSVLLGPETINIRLAGLEEPLRTGDRFLATLVFEVVGEVTVEFWVEGVAEIPADPMPAPIPNSMLDVDVVAKVTARLRASLGAETEVATLSVADPAAVAGWTRPNDAGWAFLRRTGDDWQLKLLSGESLVSPAGLRAQGLSPRIASELLAEIQSKEVSLPAQTLTRLNGFQGTLIVSGD